MSRRLTRILRGVEGVPIGVGEEVWMPTDMSNLIFDRLRTLHKGLRSVHCTAFIEVEQVDPIKEPDTFMAFRLTMNVPTSVLPTGASITPSLVYGDVEMVAELHESFEKSLRVVNENARSHRRAASGPYVQRNPMGSFGEFKSMDVSIQPSDYWNVFVARIETKLPSESMPRYVLRTTSPAATREVKRRTRKIVGYEIQRLAERLMGGFMPAVVNRTVGRRCYLFNEDLSERPMERTRNYFMQTPLFRFEYTATLWNMSDCLYAG
jgi:hypothetical protein